MKLFTKRKLKFISFSLIFTFVIVFFLTPSVSKLKHGPITIKRKLANGQMQPLEYGPTIPGWVKYDSVPKLLVYAIVMTEDIDFWSHDGYDLFEIQASFRRNMKAGKIVRGGSTITQQMIKNAFLSNSRSYIRKFRELQGTIYTENILTKQQIITWYLNIIELGTDIYGVGNAARRYFGKGVSHLSPRESVLLSIILPSPKKYGESLRKQSLSPRLKKRYAWTAMLLRKHRHITDSQWQELVDTGDFGRPLDGSKAIPDVEFYDDDEETEFSDEDEVSAEDELGTESDAAKEEGADSEGQIEAVDGVALPTENPEAPPATSPE